MSQLPKESAQKSDHRKTESYVVGFILSLIFTAIPYYLVVNHALRGSGLQITILGVALLQMLVQIFFFLHLGRGPKPLYNVVFFVSTVGIVLVVVGGSLVITHNLHYNMAPPDVIKKLAQDEAIAQVGGKKTGACEHIGASHIVTISGGKVSPVHTEARLCDSLTFLNQDASVREIAFGPHPAHRAYAGETDQNVYKGRGKTITLNQSGTYLFHDHFDPAVTGDFTVTP
jgi:cytochrome o ubiquinol oxidase operon protein cyoD